MQCRFVSAFGGLMELRLGLIFRPLQWKSREAGFTLYQLRSSQQSIRAEENHEVFRVFANSRLWPAVAANRRDRRSRTWRSVGAQKMTDLEKRSDRRRLSSKIVDGV